MTDLVVYRQLNKDYAYWTEKRRIGQTKGGHVSGLLTHLANGQVKHNLLIDCGLGTLEAIADFCDDVFWDQPLDIFITHGHIDHHAELMILSEIYCKRRGETIHDVRPPLPIYCTEATHWHLFNTHRYGYTDGNTLRHHPLTEGMPLKRGIFRITPLSVDHFEGAVIFVIEFTLTRSHKIVIGWDLKTLPLFEQLKNPSLALIEGTTWQSMDVGHTSIEDLAESGFLEQLQLQVAPQQERYGAFLVHYSGLEDEWGMLTDQQLKAKFDAAYPALAPLVRMAERGQTWTFS